MEKSELELRKKKQFYLFKRSTMFSSIYFLFFFLLYLNISTLAVSSVTQAWTLVLFLSCSILLTFISVYVTRPLRFRLNNKGVVLIEVFSVLELIKLIYWALSTY
ncbi:hypothetical protein [Halobacteriovorax sp. HLS]|uniref:hypothetical protein n=1 Tax=Halobacteriovorax sp. HLS TaxID=2234000 RepID=UPI000FDA18E9|nr:hypothetical protein [Halobacteriovorax sp. HLS]